MQLYPLQYWEVYPDDDAEVEEFADCWGFSPTMWTLGEEGAEDSGVAISSMSAYGPDLDPFLLKALLKELRSCSEEIWAQNRIRDMSENY